MALPLEQRFWDDLLRNASDWGMVVYEQDWLYTEFLGLNATRQSATGAKKWLTQMATAAARAGVTVQYCVELCGNQISGAPRHRRDVVPVGSIHWLISTQAWRWRGSFCRAPPCRP